MEVQLELKKCDFCKGDATSLCFNCMNYFCDSCFKIAHSKNKHNHTKKKK